MSGRWPNALARDEIMLAPNAALPPVRRPKAQDADFEESNHPRDESGKFGAGAGSNKHVSALREAGHNDREKFNETLNQLKNDKDIKTEDLKKIVEEYDSGGIARSKTRTGLIDQLEKVWVRESRFKNKVNKDEMVHAAGLMLVTPDDRVLFLQRSGEGDHEGEWNFPGGKLEEDEYPLEAAVREAEEEAGFELSGEQEPTQIDHATSEEKVDFTTFRVDLDGTFEPTLDDEHIGYAWSPLDNPPQPLHPGVAATLDKIRENKSQAKDEALAFDRATVREKDQDGRLKVEVSNISKATVNPYVGKEIPGAEQLGLDLDQIYMLLRDPRELAKAVDSFNNLPVLSQHVPVFAADYAEQSKKYVIGATGSDAVFQAPFLRNSLSIWDGSAIAAIESGEAREISCGYHYTPDLTPGIFEGEKYDGIMRDIIGNHVAIVQEGRAGHDVVVADSKDIVQWIFIEKALLSIEVRPQFKI